MRKHVEESVAGRAQARDGAAAAAHLDGVAGIDHGGAGLAIVTSFWPREAGLPDAPTTTVGCRPRSATMETELLYAKVDQLEAGGPLARRRSTR